MATERTPLVQNTSGETGATGLDRIGQEFADDLAQEDPNTTLFDIIVKRPTAVILALSLFALIVITTSSIASLQSPEFVDSIMQVPQIALTGVDLFEIGNREIEVHTQTQLQLNYSKMGDSYTSKALTAVGKKLGYVDTTLDGPVRIYMRQKPDCSERFNEKDDRVDSKCHGSKQAATSQRLGGSQELVDEWQYLISCRIPSNVALSLLPDDPQTIDLAVIFSDAGRTEAIAQTARNVLHSEPIVIRAEGTAIVKKFGLSLRFPFVVERDILVPRHNTDELGEVAKVVVEKDTRNGVDITALANATINNFPISANFPSLSWKIKIPGCEENENEDVCEGTTLPFALEGRDGKIEVYFRTVIDHIPEKLIEPCGNEKKRKSPLDVFISRYLAGQLTTFLVEGQRNERQQSIINDLVTGVEVPYTIFGKPASEKLIQSVLIEEVQLARSFGPGFHHRSDVANFNGKVLVDTVLPGFLEMPSKIVLMATGARGTIQLFDSRKRHFGQIVTWDDRGDDDESSWLQTISLASDKGYKITCFFDNLPLEITDRQAFSDISQEMVVNGHATLNYDAVLDVRFDTAVGQFVARSVRIKGVTDMRA